MGLAISIGIVTVGSRRTSWPTQGEGRGRSREEGSLKCVVLT